MAAASDALIFDPARRRLQSSDRADYGDARSDPAK
jgi:hypothetical protein